MATIGYIGLGIMGLPMAGHLMAGGHDVRGYDVVAEAVEAHVAGGGTAAASPAEAADGADFIFTMLPNTPHIRSALFDDDGAAKTMRKDALYIDMSTINPIESDGIRADMGALGLSMVDAPVGRTSAAARAGKSLIMVGGDKADNERAYPLFELLGDTIVDCGGPGMGHRMKVVNNYMTTVVTVVTAEALTLSDAVGLNRDTSLEVMRGTPAGQGCMNTTYPDRVLNKDLTPNFMIDLANKDVGLALALADAVNVPLNTGAAARQIYAVARAQGRGREDWTAVYPVLQGLSGVDPIC
jgi:4-hydroxybutyrate dehydrogenase/sulfolactaldehyde 3-reductase